MAFTPIIYSFGAGDYLNTCFEFLSMMFDFNKNSAILTLAKISGLLGIIFIGTEGLRRGSPGASIDWQYFMRFFVIWSLVIVPKVDVEIHDVTTQNVYKISKAPWSIAVLGWFTSSMGMGFTKMYEDNLDNMSEVEHYSRNGIAFGSRYYSVLPNVTFDTNTASLSNLYIRSCLYPALNNPRAGVTVNDVIGDSGLFSHNLEKKLAKFNAARFVDTGAKFGVIRCGELYDKTKILVNEQKDIARKRMGITQDDIIALDKQYIQGATQHENDSLETAINASILAAGMQASAIRSNSSAADAIYQAKAMRQQETIWRQGSQFSAASMVWFRIAIECLIYALFPFVCFIFLLPTGMIAFMEYIKVMFWIQTWPVMYAVLNSIVSVYAHTKSQQLAQVYSGAYSLDDMFDIADINSGVVGIVGYLTVMIPSFSWMLLNKAGSSIMGAVGSVTSSVQTAATEAGKSESSGDFSKHNVDWGNQNMTNTLTTGQDVFNRMYTGGSSVQHGSGGIESMRSDSAGHQMSVQADYMQGNSQTLSQAHTQATQATQAMGSAATTFGKGFKQGESGSFSMTADDKSSVSRGSDGQWTYTDSNGHSQQITKEAGTAMMAEAKMNSGASLLGSLVKNTTGVEFGASLRGSLNTSNKTGHETSSGDSRSVGDNQSQNVSTSAGHASNYSKLSSKEQTALLSSQKAVSEIESTAHAENLAKQKAVVLKENLTNEFIDSERAKGLSSQEIFSMDNNRGSGGHAKLLSDFEEFVANKVSQAGIGAPEELKSAKDEEVAINTLANKQANNLVNTTNPKATSRINQEMQNHGENQIRYHNQQQALTQQHVEHNKLTRAREAKGITGRSNAVVANAADKFGKSVASTTMKGLEGLSDLTTIDNNQLVNSHAFNDKAGKK